MSALLEIRDLHTHFFTTRGVLKAVNGMSLSVNRGEILAVVGESGCGKSVTAFSILRLIPNPPGKIVAGEVVFEGCDLTKLSEEEMRRIRGNGIAMIFQEPMTSLNPVLTIGEQVSEVLIEHDKVPKQHLRARVIVILESVGIADPMRRLGQYPHELSGGMRQRVMIAMALACEPQLIIADEPTTALDVTVQAQVLDLLTEMRDRYGMALLLITHDLGVVAETADRVAVMYAGRKVEEADVETLFRNSLHPYTQGLLRATPRGARTLPGTRPPRLAEIPGMVPALDAMPDGCAFAPRCPLAIELCLNAPPPLAVVEAGHQVACYRAADTRAFLAEQVA